MNIDLDEIRLRLNERNPDRHDPVGLFPFYIFDRVLVSWEDLYPYLSDCYPMQSEKAVYRTFPVPSSYSGSDISGIVSNDSDLIFPRFGGFQGSWHRFHYAAFATSGLACLTGLSHTLSGSDQSRIS